MMKAKLMRVRTLDEAPKQKGHTVEASQDPELMKELLVERSIEAAGDAREVLGADDPDELLPAMADMLEALRGLAEVTGFGLDAVLAAADRKRASLGGFVMAIPGEQPRFHATVLRPVEKGKKGE